MAGYSQKQYIHSQSAREGAGQTQYKALRLELLDIYKKKIINSYTSLPHFVPKYETLLQILLDETNLDPYHPSVSPYSGVNQMILELEIDTIEKFDFYGSICFQVDLLKKEIFSKFPEEIGEHSKEEFLRVLYIINPEGLYGIIKQHLIYNYDKACINGITMHDDLRKILSLDPLEDLNSLDIKEQIILLDHITTSHIGNDLEKLNKIEILLLKIAESVVNDGTFKGDMPGIIHLLELVLTDLYESRYKLQLIRLKAAQGL